MSTKATSLRRSGWRRPPGPVNVWRIVDGTELLANGTKRPVRFSIQEVPEERRDEALQLMIKHFLVDEPICKCNDAKNDPKFINDFSILWKYCLDEQGIVEAAYVIDLNGQISDLAAINMLYIVSDETKKELDLLEGKLQSHKFIQTLTMMTDVTKKADPCKIFDVDKYLSALGLCVIPRFRGHQLGLRMLEARKEIGQKYGIPISATHFTATASQILAERAGYKLEYSQEYADFLTEEGKPMFPNIETKEIKLMMKILY